MLADRDRLLLTASVDGELTARQRRHLIRLLRRSPEARRLLRELKGDSDELRALPPPPPLPADLSASVLQTIAARRLQMRRRFEPRPATRLPVQFSFAAAAAAVLFAVGLSAYLSFAALFAPTRSPGTPDPGANAQETPVPSPGDKGLAERKRPDPERPPEQPGPGVKPEGPGPGPELPPPVVEGPKHPEPMEGPKEEPPGPVLASPGRELFELKLVELSPPVVLPLRELDPEPSRQKLTAELRKDAAFRVELPCPDTTKAFPRLQGVCKERGLPLLVESTAQAHLKKPDPRTNYVLLLDNVLPEELAALLLQLGAEDRKGKPIDAQFEAAVLRRLNKVDQKEITELLGVEWATPTGVSVDPKKPLEEGTLAQLTGQAPPRPEPGKPAAKGPEGQALALLYSPGARMPKSGPEVQRFLDGRKPPRPGSLRVMLVLRGV